MRWSSFPVRNFPPCYYPILEGGDGRGAARRTILEHDSRPDFYFIFHIQEIAQFQNFKLARMETKLVEFKLDFMHAPTEIAKTSFFPRHKLSKIEQTLAGRWCMMVICNLYTVNVNG